MSSGFYRLGANVSGKRPTIPAPVQASAEGGPTIGFRAALREPATTNTLTSRELARSQGFTGDICTACGQAHMQIAGHCMVCADCGTTTGCS